MSHGLRLIAPVQFSVEPQERRRFKAAARREGVSLSEWIRVTLRERLVADRVAATDAQRNGGDEPPHAA